MSLSSVGSTGFLVSYRSIRTLSVLKMRVLGVRSEILLEKRKLCLSVG